jgi:hypothetical protein
MCFFCDGALSCIAPICPWQKRLTWRRKASALGSVDGSGGSGRGSCVSVESQPQRQDVLPMGELTYRFMLVQVLITGE